ncbi:MAG: flagellar biosynthesis protein FlgM [Micavibrio aeruginosavorus]|uniref:Flagellar biosynthesis protein FlgM n=1 Tax=Micavibrio aeruginosavorus TaxID=349221 RepID=A0A2W5FMA4_9BACT|nr:MAG: flagellar biosynthesis protein FlgM [Micavibrio aeruginosavorus]
MRWQMGRRSSNVENRGRRGGIVVGGGGTLALVVVYLLLGGDPSVLMNQLGSTQGSNLTSEQQSEQTDFVSVVLGSTEDVWRKEFEKIGKNYEEPKLVLFGGAVQSACGYAQSAVGPFYCPADRDVYLDLDFFQQLETQLGAPGDFARAYVIAHEIGHHVQTLLGSEEKARQAMQSARNKEQSNAISVKLELQADCYAGIWAHYAGKDYNLIEEGDVEEALNAASRIGDDALQTQAQGYAVPDSFTHGSSQQRHDWFKKGLQSGSIEACDAFR